MNLTTFFDRIYILNLPHRVDRREATIRELKSIGVELESGKVVFFPAIKPDHPEPFHKLGSKGCFLSTLAILRQAQERQEGHVLIFQDDIKFPPFYKKFESELLEHLDEQPWDIAQFGYCHTKTDIDQLQIPFCSWIDTSMDTIGAHFFAINKRAIARYIHFLESLLSNPSNHPDCGPMPIDGTFTIFRRKHTDIIRLIAVPSFGGQRSSRSDVTPKWYDEIPLFSDLAQLYRYSKSRI